MNISGIGELAKDEDFDLHYSDEVDINVLGGSKCRIVLEGYDDDDNPDDFRAAIANFLSIEQSVLQEAEHYIYLYYEDCMRNCDAEDEEFLQVSSAEDIWQYIRFGDEARFKRRAYGDNEIYVSLQCGCDWEYEHGLQIVFRNGLAVSKVGPFDGHLTNADAFADESLENVIYR
ncbi:MAG: hypothetical protein AB8G18_02380 [Gammaproteobacteria bacterium]